jgi:hypothetical protein
MTEAQIRPPHHSAAANEKVPIFIGHGAPFWNSLSSKADDRPTLIGEVESGRS